MDDDRKRFDVQPAAAEGPEAAEAACKKAVLDKSLDGCLSLPKDVVGAAKASYYGRNVSNFSDLRTLERTVSRVLVARRLTSAGLDAARVDDLTRGLDLKTIRVSEQGEREDKGAAMLLAMILMMMLYGGLLMWGQAVMTSVIEEKTSRVVEVMASGVPSTTLLLGKLLGVGGSRAHAVPGVGAVAARRVARVRQPRRDRDARGDVADAGGVRDLLRARLPLLRGALRRDRRRGEHRRRRRRAWRSRCSCPSSSRWSAGRP